MNNDNINWNDYNFNFDDEYPQQPRPQQSRPAPRREGQFSIDELRRVHNAETVQQSAAESDAYYEYAEAPEEELPAQKVPVRKRRKKKKHRVIRAILWILGILLLLTLITAAVLWFSQKMPQNEAAGKTRKEDCCAVLLAGTDEGGVRTDTLMVLYIDRAEKQLRLLSIPRDTMVNRDSSVPKINGAYYANGSGEEGMDCLMGYVQDLIGYRPDGYALIDLNCFEDLVNLMGGVRFDVPMDMFYEDPTQDLFIDLKAGMQHLNGKQAMWLVRFRSGYAAADLQRVSVQRDFLSAALSQWKKPWNILRVPGALSLLSKHTLTDMEWNNFTWLGVSAVLCGTGGLESDTLPGEGAYVNGGAYYVEDRAAAAALISEKYNLFEEEISAYDLHPYGY